MSCSEDDTWVKWAWTGAAVSVGLICLAVVLSCYSNDRKDAYVACVSKHSVKVCKVAPP